MAWNTRTREEIEKIVGNLGYKLLETYFPKQNGKSRKIIIEDGDGYKYDVLLEHLIDGNRGISFVHRGNKFSIYNISIWLKKYRNEFELYGENTYEKNTEHLNLYHNTPQCQEKFNMSWNDLSHGKGCSVCSGQQVGKKTSLAHRRPDLALEWHPNNELSPEEVTCGSNARVYWICSTCGYGENGEWFSQINSRKNGSGCPACSGQVVTDLNRLSIILPDVSAEWDYNKNTDTPNDVSYGKNEKRWWICPKGHEYFSYINSRARGGNGCKKCSSEIRESLIATELKEFYFNNYIAEIEYPICINPETGYPLPFDIYLLGGENPEINGAYIEVQGGQHFKFIPYWHKTEENFKYNKKLDKTKKNFAEEHGTYIEIDLRKIKTTEDAIKYIENILSQL